MLQELHIPFDLLDKESSFDAYNVLVLADDLRISAELQQRLDAFLAKGGKLILSNNALLKSGEDVPAFDLPLEYSGVNPLYPDFIRPAETAAPDFINTPFVMYRPSQRIKVTGGESLGQMGSLPPLAAAWFPDALLLTIALSRLYFVSVRR